MNKLSIITFFFLLFFQNSTLFAQSSSCDSVPSIFQRTIELTNEEDVPYDMVSTPDGGYFVVGGTGGFLDIFGNEEFAREAFILKLNLRGEVEWAKSVGTATDEPFPFTSDVDETYTKVLRTSDNNFLAAGVQSPSRLSSPEFSRGLLFTMFDEDGEVLWNKVVTGVERASSINLINTLIPLPNDEFLFATTWQVFNVGAPINNFYMVRINADGDVLMKKEISLVENEDNVSLFIDVTALNGNELIISGISSDRLRDSNNERNIKGFLIKSDHNGNILKNRTFEHPTDGLGLFFSHGVSLSQNRFLLQGDVIREDNTSLGIYKENYILKIDSDLNVIDKKGWLHSEQTDDFRESVNLHGWIPLKRQGSSVFMGLESWRRKSALRPDLDAFNLVKLDTSLNLIWNKGYGTVAGTDYGTVSGNETLLTFEFGSDSSTILMAGYSNGFGTEDGGLYLINADQSGYADTCNVFPFEWAEKSIPDFIIDSLELQINDFGSVVDNPIETNELIPTVVNLCPPPTFPDAVIANLREMENCPPFTKAVIDICNLGENALPQSVPIAVYDKNPTKEPANLLLTTTLSRGLAINDCQQMILNTPFGAEQLFVVLNDTGTVNLPYHLGWSFPQNDKRECTYLNNMDSISLTPYRAQPVDLGDDKEICEGDGVRYQLLGDYSSVEWHDGNRTNIYDTNSSEVISVTVIDSCGAIFRDTVVVSVNPNYFIEIDTIIPKGGTYQGISYFSDTTFTQDLMSVDGCDSIAQINLTVDVSSVKSLLVDEGILLYPNPSSGVCFIDFDEATSEKYEVSFYNTLSQKVATIIISKGTKEQSVDLNHLSSGAYYYGVSSEGQLVHSGKLILLK